VIALSIVGVPLLDGIDLPEDTEQTKKEYKVE
jgi:hypothetical protein